MFGNHPLPNIAPSLPSVLTTTTQRVHRRLRRSPRDRPHGLSEGVPSAYANAHRPRHVTVAYCRHVTPCRRSPRPPHRYHRPSPHRGCGRATPGMSPTTNNNPSAPPSNATSRNRPCHVTRQKRPPSNATSRRPRERGGQQRE